MSSGTGNPSPASWRHFVSSVPPSRVSAPACVQLHDQPLDRAPRLLSSLSSRRKSSPWTYTRSSRSSHPCLRSQGSGALLASRRVSSSSCYVEGSPDGRLQGSCPRPPQRRRFCVSPQDEDTPRWLPERWCRILASPAEDRSPRAERPEQTETKKTPPPLQSEPDERSPESGPRDDPIWSECVQDKPHIISPHGVPSFSVTDWSKLSRDQREPHAAYPPGQRVMRPRFHNVSLPGGLFSPGGMFHAQLRKLGATMGPVTVKTGENSFARAAPFDFSVRAGVPRPFLWIVGSGTVTPHTYVGPQGHHLMYQIECSECVLTNRVPITLPTGGTGPVMVFLVMQPPYVLLPVEVEGPWYASYGYPFALELQSHVHRFKRFLGLVIAGISTLVALIATATVSSVTLSQSVQTAKHVNSLAKNVSHAVATQEHIDQKILSRLDGLEEAVEYVGTQLSILRTQMSLVCHGGFQHMCHPSKGSKLFLGCSETSFARSMVSQQYQP